MADLGLYYSIIMFQFPFAAPKRCTNAIALNDRMNHLLWMIENMPEVGTSKYNRWLGFIQGTMAAFNLRSIDEMREDNA